MAALEEGKAKREVGSKAAALRCRTVPHFLEFRRKGVGSRANSWSTEITSYFTDGGVVIRSVVCWERGGRRGEGCTDDNDNLYQVSIAY